MALEIERKFLVCNDNWRINTRGTVFRQGYLSTDPLRTVRVRLEGSRGKLTIKGKTSGISRAEYEYDIPAEDATELLTNLCHLPLIEKTRYCVTHAGRVWEVDEFMGENRGLIIAEVELASPSDIPERPDWLGKEVSADPRYFNASLVNHPYCRW